MPNSPSFPDPEANLVVLILLPVVLNMTELGPDLSQSIKWKMRGWRDGSVAKTIWFTIMRTEFRSQDPHCKATMLCVAVILAPKVLESRVFLGPAGFQLSWENVSSGFKERPWLKGIGEDWKKKYHPVPSCGFLACTQLHITTHICSYTPQQVHTNN